MDVNDASRYLNSLGMDDPIPDLLRAYIELKLPMQLYQGLYVPEFVGPGYAWSKLALERPDGVFYDGDDLLHHLGFFANVTYPPGRDDVVYIESPIPIWNGDDFDDQVAPVYVRSGPTEYGECFDLFTWDWAITTSHRSFLRLNRKALDQMYSLATGKSEELDAHHQERPRVEPAKASPLYLEESHDSYPPELHAAIMLWEGLYVKGERNTHHSHSQAAERWIEKNADLMPTVNQSNHGTRKFIDRLVTVTSPQTRKQRKD